MVMNGEFWNLWEEEFFPYFKILSKHLFGVPEEKMNTSVRMVGRQTIIKNVTSQIWNKSVNRRVMIFCRFILSVCMYINKIVR
jgi:hypothetical protein